ncbi:5'-AMP-activated protein kinase subunit beta-1 [Parasteatoda tepidariorum]|uniref:5'-AMP-activated protein kinase subunit beta-1 n=1 Tax=Parasteatoda tepidariorum TaxID=114398 RepID=UPI001C71E437|nr:5'-AMP-activated protein kinase subunit beta-1-like [Parasteatoda tepidariorum]
MGTTSSTKRDRAYSSDNEGPPPSCKEGKVFEFSAGNRKEKFGYQSSLDDYDDFSNLSRDKSDEMNRPGEKLLPTVFKWAGGGKDVMISGSFSDWKPIPMVQSQGDFALILEIPEGDHQYKFKVDGQWQHNPSEPTVDNDVGSKNNTISVKKSDFLVFEALAADSIGSTYTGSPPGSYSQEIPQPKPNEKTVRPPVLPPHLLQVILNKDVMMACEPNLLPEPNHVMLNHLYALSIKDGVVVLSATHRYKKKYVTTLLYKPI